MDPSQESWKPQEMGMNPASSAGYGGTPYPPPSYYTEPPPLTGGTTYPPGVNQSLMNPTAPMYPQGCPPPYPTSTPNTDYGYSPYPRMANSGLPPSNAITAEPTRTFVPLPRNTNDYLPLAIVSLLCCFPLGLVALIYSFKTRDALRRGDSLQAAQSSVTTRGISILGLFLGFFCIFAGIGFTIFYVTTSRMSQDFNSFG